jgi:hypothetical protein
VDSYVLGDAERGVRPLPDFAVAAWTAPRGHVAVVRVRPTTMPPCITNGTVYERLPGKTPPVRDPSRLANFFARGDQARANAEARADRAAFAVLDHWLPPRFPREGFPGGELPPDDEAEALRFAVGVAATGNPANIAGRLFRPEFATQMWNRLRDRRSGPVDFSWSPEPVYWSQDALTWRHLRRGIIDVITVVRAAWDGTGAAGELVSMEDVYPDEFVAGHVVPHWQMADEIVRDQLGGFGDVYVTVVFAGGRFRRRQDSGPIVMRRGPILPGVDDGRAASLGHEFMRAVGNPAGEPDPG